MFNKIIKTHLVAVISLSAFSIGVHAEDDFINQSLTANLALMKVNYKLSAPSVAQTLKVDTAKLKASYSKLANPKYVYFGSAQIYQVTISDMATAQEKNELMGGLEGGVRYFINSRWSATLSGEFQRLVYFSSKNGAVSGGGHWTPGVNAAAYYQAISKTNYSLIPSLKTSLLIGTGNSKMGTAYALHVNYNYYLPEVRLSAGLGYESRTQKYNDTKLTEYGPQITLGAGMSF